MGVLRPITETENKEILLGMLKELVHFFNVHNIRYYIAGGTLLGTIRHKGFIPWDDDIDILMPRCDYIKLLKLVKENAEHFRKINIEIISHNCDRDTYYKRFKFADTRTIMEEFGEMRSAVFIDIFPLDFFKDNKRLMLRGRICHTLSNLLDLCSANRAMGTGVKRVIYTVLLMLHRAIGRKKMIDFYERKFVEFAKFREEGIACASQSWGMPICFTDAKLWRDVEIMKFEGIDVSIPVGWDAILTQCYGDYMTPPPVDKRFAHDNYKMYWRD